MEPQTAISQTKRAALELRQKIVTGEFVGGTRIYEVALSDLLGISRTPAREAMGRLAEEGLLDRLPGGGFRVREFSRRDVLDAIELRGTLEGMAARLAAERGGRGLKHLATLVSELDQCFSPKSDRVDFESYAALNESFHRELVALAESPLLTREIDRVKALPFASPSAFVPGASARSDFFRSLVLAQAQHRALAEAIAAHEGARAEALAREHSRIARANFEAGRDHETTLRPVALTG